MQPDEYQALKDSIEVIGVQNPITLFDGLVIDGWHRYTAANEVGLPCPSKLLGDVDPVDFVRSQNDARRNVSASQRALAISAIYAWRPHGDQRSAPGTDRYNNDSKQSKTTAEMANIAGVGTKTMEQAKAVQSKATKEVKEAVKAGKMSVKKAAETVKPKKAAKPATAKPSLTVVVAPAVPPEDEYTELDAAQDQILELQSMLAIANMGTVAEEDKDQAKNLIAELRAEIKKLTAMNKALTVSRDSFQNKAAELQKQINRQRREIDHVTGRKTA